MTDRSHSTQCPVCLQDIFNEEGVAEEEVAEIMCNHLLHSDCLASVGQSLNADGKRFGFGGFGPRSGCPTCNRPVSCWTSSIEAGYFKSFWVKPIEDALLELGSNTNGPRMPVAAELVRKKLKESPKIPERQKQFINEPTASSNDRSGFYKALQFAGSVQYNANDVYYAGFLTTRGIWKYDAKKDTLWHWDWGKRHPRLITSCSMCSAQPQQLSVCAACKDSCEAPFYCNKDCQKAHWPNHKKNCKVFRIMKQGGTREELSQRLREV